MNQYMNTTDIASIISISVNQDTIVTMTVSTKTCIEFDFQETKSGDTLLYIYCWDKRKYQYSQTRYIQHRFRLVCNGWDIEIVS